MTLRIATLVALTLTSWSVLLRPLPADRAPIALAEFGRMMESLSEPEGYFDTDNFVSNEAAYLRVLPAMRRIGLHGGAYLGVGPDQNYSYIAEIEPDIAVIIDIRRQNALEHLYFKALFQKSATRAAYLERLFGRRIRLGTENPERASIGALLDAAASAPRDPKLQAAMEAEAVTAIRGWSLPLKDSDFAAFDAIARAFMEGGPELKFTSYNRAPRSYHPTLRQLLEETDGAAPANYLAREEKFRRLKVMHRENRIIPIVGDFSGPRAFQNVARELRRRGAAVRCFYASNVEFYLFRGERWDQYLRNLRGLPLESGACIIRSYANLGQPHPAQIPGYYMTTVLQRLDGFLRREAAGENQSYWDIVTRDCILP